MSTTMVGLYIMSLGPTAAMRSYTVQPGSAGAQLPCVATGRHCRSLGSGEAKYQQFKTYTSLAK